MFPNSTLTFLPSAPSSSGVLATNYVGMSPTAQDAYHNSSSLNFAGRAFARPNALIGVSEGDSWFDYAPSFLEDATKGDLLAQLHHTGRYNIFNVGKAGDTLENMVYGTDLQRNGQAAPSEIGSTLDAIRAHQPHFFLFSAGGNDMAGHDGVYLETYLNHATSGLAPLRLSRAQDTFQVFNKAAIQYMIDQVTATKPDIQIFIHGYDYAVPDGRAVSLAPIGWINFAGPWLLPAFARKRIAPFSARQATINSLIDLLNDTIKDLASQNHNVHHIDCRGTLKGDLLNYKQDWSNELHPTVAGFGKIAAKFDSAISAVFP